MLRATTLNLAAHAMKVVPAFAEGAKKASEFPGRTLTYGSLKLECLVEPVQALLTEHFDDLIAGHPITGYAWDGTHVAELDRLSDTVMNGHVRSSIFAAALDHIAYADAQLQDYPFRSLFDHMTSPQVYRVPALEEDWSLLKGAIYGHRTESVPAVQAYGVYSWGGLRNNLFYPEGKALGQEDCCSFVQKIMTSVTGEVPPSDYSTVDLRKTSLRLKGDRGYVEPVEEKDGGGEPLSPVVEYLCRHLTYVPFGQGDLSNVKPGDFLLLRKNVTEESPLGAGGHVSMVMGFWDNQPIVLEYNRDREGRGMDGFGCSVKDIWGDLFPGYSILRPVLMERVEDVLSAVD